MNNKENLTIPKTKTCIYTVEMMKRDFCTIFAFDDSTHLIKASKYEEHVILTRGKRKLG